MDINKLARSIVGAIVNNEKEKYKPIVWLSSYYSCRYLADYIGKSREVVSAEYWWGDTRMIDPLSDDSFTIYIRLNGSAIVHAFRLNKVPSIVTRGAFL